jgi:hypothetical protein
MCQRMLYCQLLVHVVTHLRGYEGRVRERQGMQWVTCGGYVMCWHTCSHTC